MKEQKKEKKEWKNYDPTAANLIIIGLAMVMVIMLIIVCSYSTI